MARVCPGCGVLPEVWEDDPNALVSDHYECPGCQRLEEERDNVPEGTKGVHYRLIPLEEAQRRLDAQLERMERKRKMRAEADGDS